MLVSIFKILSSLCIFILSELLFAQNDIAHELVEGNSMNNLNGDTIFLFAEDFDDEDYSNNPIWQPDIRQACALDLPQVSIENGVLKVLELTAGSCGTNASIEINLNIPLSDSTKIKFDVRPVYSSVDEGAGWLDVEYPVYIILWLTDINNRFLRLRFGYNYRGGESFYEKDNISIAFPNCGQNAWLRNEVFTLKNYFPDAVSINKLEVGGSGWDYEGYIDNISIFEIPPKNDKKAKDIQYQPVEEYGSFSKNEKAIEMYKKNLKMNGKMGDKEKVDSVLFLLGDFYLKTGIYDSALLYLH